ncbi:MAG: peptide-methionine (R)-S-oxide reductase [Candidatus Doudnabacteria bacterium RIFCSPHIGHO2_01_43_10]|nr:MAG: peptide-methionine (R)-S-oxide reductase [Candidatus Doudnabacteria bacterium RIFCSPHIGHO2_01_43_10]
MNDEELKKKLTPEQYEIMRKKGTEAPFSGQYVHTKDKGMYVCAVCNNELFSSDTKFDSGTGWPSFTEPANLKNIELRDDDDHGTRLPTPDAAGIGGQVHRIEVTCKNCGSHLGHVFDDGPKDQGGNRYCINSACLMLKKG